ncbi:MAG: phosphomannose isomerase type II C-terminal cupin domain [Candidatus Coatesbacteria bacterium]|nr:phosphomannose isomerase type II C-terminal cupin domain [Candidatus Coatesbacteria bacterium]
MSVEKEQRPWGRFEVLLDEPGYKVKRVTVEPGKRLSLQFHHHRSEHWHIVLGEGFATIGDREIVVGAGQSIDIPSNVQHRLENAGGVPLVFVEVQRGSKLVESDIVRLQDDYGRCGAVSC